MRGYRPGLWLLVVGLLVQLVMWLSMDVVGELVTSHVVSQFPLGYLDVFGAGDLAATLALIAGAVLARMGSSGPRRWWFTGAIAELVLYAVLRLAPWLLQHVGTDVTLDQLKWIYRIAAIAHIAAFASVALVAQSGAGNRRLATVALWVTAIRALLVVYVELERHAEWARLATNGIWLFSVISMVAVVVDMLGAFGVDDHRTPDAQVRSRTRSATVAIAIGLAVLGIAQAAFAVWVTKRTSSVASTGGTLAYGTVFFMAGALALWRLQRRELPLRGFAMATVATLAIGRLVLGAYVDPVAHSDLELHQLPGMSIELPAGTTDVDFAYPELGKLTVMTHHTDLGLVTLAWSPTKDPVAAYRSAAKSNFDIAEFSEHSRDVDVDGVTWSIGSQTTLYASWHCPSQNRWFLFSVSTYSKDTTAIRTVASRVFSTIRCNAGSGASDSFAMPAPEEFKSTWSVELNTNDVLHAAGMSEDATQSSVVAGPQPHGIVESGRRTVYEQHDADAYRIAAVWHCYTLGIDVAIYAVAPPTRPRESLLAAISGAHCPR